tara:strand:+ start:544 stop:801 length:258 start_codon:yes stop_codon:yes gene_type:complete
MARISNTKGIKNIGGSQFELIMTASHRARSYDAANPPLVSHLNKRGMTALREIEAGLTPIKATKESMIDKYRTVFPKDADPILDN